MYVCVYLCVLISYFIYKSIYNYTLRNYLTVLSIIQFMEFNIYYALYLSVKSSIYTCIIHIPIYLILYLSTCLSLCPAPHLSLLPHSLITAPLGGLTEGCGDALYSHQSCLPPPAPPLPPPPKPQGKQTYIY